MKKHLSEAFWKGLGKYIYKELLYKMAEEYVKKTDNKYDDAGLVFLDDMIEDWLKVDEE